MFEIFYHNRSAKNNSYAIKITSSLRSYPPVYRVAHPRPIKELHPLGQATKSDLIVIQ